MKKSDRIASLEWALREALYEISARGQLLEGTTFCAHFTADQVRAWRRVLEARK